MGTIHITTRQKLFFMLLMSSIFFTGCIKKDQAIEDQAKSASLEYCNCVKENIFRYKYVEELYSSCNQKVAAKFRLYKLKLGLDSLADKNVYRPKTKDSITIFMKEFQANTDSCSSLPIHKYSTKL